MRYGQGIRYTEDYVDEGVFDKVILYGIRNWRNGNVYKGTFVNNKMETVYDTEYDGRF